MSFLDARGLYYTPGVITEVPTGRLLWVDQVNGIDDLGVRERLTLPFKTLEKARDMANPQDTIVVMPGNHVAFSSLAMNGVNWHFMPGASASRDTSNSPLFLVTSAMTFNVTGAGNLSSGQGNHVLEVNHSSAQVFFQCRRMWGTTSGLKVTAASEVLVEADWINGDEGSAIDISGGTVKVKARLIDSTSLHGLNIAGGAADIEAYRIHSDGGKGVLFTGGTANLAAFEIFSQNDPAVEYNSPYDTLLTLRGARLVSASERAVYITGGSVTTPALRLWNCFLKAPSGSYSIEPASGSATVGLFSPCTANRLKNNITFTPSGVSFTDTSTLT